LKPVYAVYDCVRQGRSLEADGGHADVNPMEDHGFTYTRDRADPDGHTWAGLWMDPAAMRAVAG
jgi:predicted lactoylglutathione lyase